VTVAGVGLGLRWDFDEQLVETLPALDFLEVAPENYIERGGYHADAFAFLASHYPVVTHGLSMSLGGVDPLDRAYLEALRRFIAETKSPWHSDHLSFGSAQGRVLHDLLPIAFTEAGVKRLVARIGEVEDALGVPFAVENISFYLPPEPHEMGEAEFIARVVEGADCGLLLDVNNLYVNATNFNLDVDAWLRTVPLGRVKQIHVAGHEWFDEKLQPQPAKSQDALIVDTHGADVPDPVLSLFARVIREVIHTTGPVPVVLERDHAVPPLAQLLAEVARVKQVVASAGLHEGSK
jgi:uncharacterized protein